MNDWAKIFAFTFFLVFPFIGGYVPEFKFLGLTYTGERLFLACFTLILAYHIVQNNLKLNLSGISIWMLVYSVFIVMNRIIQDDINNPEIINYLLPAFFLIFIDNLKFKPKDLRIFTRILIIVGIGTFIGSFIQLTIDPYFYIGYDPESEDYMETYAFGGLFRNQSIFRSIGNNEGGIAVSCLAIYFLFMNYYRYKWYYILLTLLLVFSVYVVFAKYVWISFLIGIVFFVYHKYPSKKYYLFPISIIVIVFIYTLSFETIEQTTVYQNRINVTTHEGRVESTRLFLDQFFLQKPIFGYGVSSWFYGPYRAQLHIGIHVAYFEILFRGGIVGLAIFSIFVYHMFSRALTLKKITGNPIFLVFITVYLFINCTAVFIRITFYGYYVMMFYMAIYYQIYAQSSSTLVRVHRSSNIKSSMASIRMPT